MTTGKPMVLTRLTFVGKIMSLLFNMLSRLVITFLPRSKCLLISWMQSPPTVILELPKIKSDTASTVSPSICHEVMGPDAMILRWEPLGRAQIMTKPLRRAQIVTKVTRWERSLQGSSYPRGHPGDTVCPLSLSVLLLLCFLLILEM